MRGEEETIDMSGTMEEDREVLENLSDHQWDHGFPDEVEPDINDNGNQSVIND